MKKNILFILVIIYSSTLLAQTVIVTDKTNLQPLSNVTIHSNNPKVSCITSSNGKADIREFIGADSIWFHHVGYLPKTYNYKELSGINFKVTLSEKTFSLDEVVVSASRFEEKRKDVSQPIQVIKSKELALMNQPTTADVLQNTGNILVQKSQLGGGSPIIRGFETNKVLIVVDGVRMNNAIYRGGHQQNILTLDNTLMDKVEIVFGPGSVVYGSDALGGVMHFYTKNPILSDSSDMKIKTRAFTRYSSAYSEKTGRFDINLGWKKFGSLTSITYSDFGDLIQGNKRNSKYGDWGKRTFYVERINSKDSMFINNNVNLQKQSAYKQYDLVQKFLFKQNDKISHILNLQYSISSDIPRYDRLTIMSGNKPAYSQWYYGPQKRMFGSYGLHLNKKNVLYDHARIIFSYQNIEESRHDRKFNSSIKNNRMEKLDIVTLNVDFEKKINKNEIRYGLEGTYNKVNSRAKKENILNGTSVPLDTRYPDGGSTLQTNAGYFTHTIEISKKLIFNDGIRISYIQLLSLFKEKLFFPIPYSVVMQKNTALNGNLGLVYMPAHDWRFTVLGSSGFRAPNIDDLSKVFESTPGKVIVPNPNLKPEYTYNADLGISKTIHHTINIGTTGFYTLYKNAITTQPSKFNGQDSIIYNSQLSGVQMNVNAKDAYIYGFNAYLTADVTDIFSITNTINYTFGRIKTDTIDYPLDHIPPVFGKTSFILNLKKFKSEFFILYNSTKLSKDYNLFGEDNQIYSADPVNGLMPGWMTLNIKAAHQFNKYIQLQLACENILDKNYRIFASNISAPGRNFVITLNFQNIY